MPVLGARERERQLEAAVGERQSLDVEARADLARPLGPAQLRRLDAAAGEEAAAVVAELVGQPRRGHARPGGEPEPQRERFAGEELRARLALRPAEPNLGDPRLAASPLVEP